MLQVESPIGVFQRKHQILTNEFVERHPNDKPLEQN